MKYEHTDPRDRSLAVVERPLGSLTPWKNNPRTHSKKQIRQIAESLKQFGWTNPVLVDDDDDLAFEMTEAESAPMSLPTTGLRNSPAGTRSC